jgi:hypothetical protein
VTITLDEWEAMQAQAAADAEADGLTDELDEDDEEAFEEDEEGDGVPAEYDDEYRA